MRHMWHFNLCIIYLIASFIWKKKSKEKMQPGFAYYRIFLLLVMIDIISRTRSALSFSIEATQFKEVSE